MVAAAAVAPLGCQRLAGLAVKAAPSELAVAVELALAVALSARPVSLDVVGVVLWNHLHCPVTHGPISSRCERLQSTPLMLWCSGSIFTVTAVTADTWSLSTPPPRCVGTVGIIVAV